MWECSYAPCNVMNELLFTILFAWIMFHSCVGTVKALAIWWLWKFYYNACTDKVSLLCCHVHAVNCNMMNNSSSCHNTCTHTALFLCWLVHVDCNLMTYAKTSFTILPLINRFHYCVGTFMLCTRSWLCKTLIAKVALIIFLSCV